MRWRTSAGSIQSDGMFEEDGKGWIWRCGVCENGQEEVDAVDPALVTMLIGKLSAMTVLME